MDKGLKARTHMAPGALEQRKRKEVVLTREEAVRKKLPKGYVLEPVLPAESTRHDIVADRDVRTKRQDAGKRSEDHVEALNLNSGEGHLGNTGGKPLHDVNGKNHNLSVDIPGRKESAPGTVRGPLTSTERESMRRSFASELQLLQNVAREIESRESDMADQALSAGSDGLGDSRKRMRRIDDALSPPEMGIGETSQSETPLPRLKHSSSFQMSAGESIGGQTPKRTPKANTAYINQDFISGQDKIPPQEKAKTKGTGIKKSGSASGLNGGRVLDLNDPKRQRVEAARAKRMVDIMRQCQAVLKKCMTHKYSWVFNQPVDVEGLGLHDYLTIIKKPMDLGTVNSNLKASLYQHPDEFYADVSRVWSNAMTYNQPGSDVHIMAADLKKLFEESYRKITSRLKDDAAKREQEEKELKEWTPVREKNEVLELERRLQALESHVVAQAAAQKPKPRGTAGPPKPKPGDKNKREMTYAEKQKLSVNLGKLPSDRLERVLQIIQQHNPNFGSQQGEEIELDIDSLDVETLWELDRYVVNCMKSKSKMKKSVPQAAASQAPIPQQQPIPEAESSRGRDGGEGEDSVNIDDGAPQGPSSSLMAPHKDAHSAKSEDSSSSSASSDDSSSSSGSDSGSDSGSESDEGGDEAQSKDVALKRPAGKSAAQGLPGSSPTDQAAADPAPGPGPAPGASLTDGNASGTGTGTGSGPGAGFGLPPSGTPSSAGQVTGQVTGHVTGQVADVPQLEQEASDDEGAALGGAQPGSPAAPATAGQEARSVAAPEAAPEAESEKKAEAQMDEDASLRAALTRKKYADIILKAKRGAIQGPVTDPKQREEMERKQREERARIEAEAKAAQEASRRKAEQAAIAARKKREEEREAERRRLLEMQRTVDIDENQRVLKDLHIFGAEPTQTPTRKSEERSGQAPSPAAPMAFPGLGHGETGNPLGNFGLELAGSDDDEDDDDEPSAAEVEEGEI